MCCTIRIKKGAVKSAFFNQVVWLLQHYFFAVFFIV